ncbi:MAG TPA: hypothetical protein VE398_24015, partial [Acidobacteriota bacterium]|nr:hypothetical protein [Acidobacteriota bacterium]
FSWYTYAPKLLKGRGDIVWIYGGPPGVSRVSSAITENPLRVWLYGIDGWVHWLAVKPGEDPWFHFDGGGTALAFSGARFGIDGPIPSVRLKLQRNCLQDLTLLDSFKMKYPLDQLKSEAAKLYNGTRPEDWWTPRPALADLPPSEWTNSSIDAAMRAGRTTKPELHSAAWHNVHSFIMKLASEAK